VGIYVADGAIPPENLDRAVSGLTGLRDDFQTDEAAIAESRVSPQQLSDDLRRDGDALRPLLSGDVVIETPRARFTIGADHESMTGP